MASGYDIGSFLNTNNASAAYGQKKTAEYTTDLLVQAAKEKKTADKYSMDMEGFLKLMVVQLTNQGIDESSDPSEMLNQMVQMQMVTAITTMSETMATLTDSNVMSYAASLVGEEVTIGVYDDNGNLVEKVVRITGTGRYNGEQVLFVGDEMYPLNSVMAVGRLPDIKSDDEVGDKKDDDDNTGNVGDSTGSTDQTDGDKTGSTDQTEGTTGGDNTTDNGESGNTGDSEYDGSSGAPTDIVE